MNKRKFTESQYATSANLQSRIDIYTYGTNPTAWAPWVFDVISPRAGQRILEIGCGTGYLWSQNIKRIPESLQILLTDQSSGMIDTARKALSEVNSITYHVVHAENLAYPPGAFDSVIANHMLYHLENPDGVLASISRMLSPRGALYAATNGEGHLEEMKNWLTEFDPTFVFPEGTSKSFTLENGTPKLARHFSHIRIIDHENILEIPDSDPILRFALSIFNGRETPDLRGREQAFTEFLESKRTNGIFRITARAGIFICRNNGNERV